VRGFRLHLASSGVGTPKINATVSALRFFYSGSYVENLPSAWKPNPPEKEVAGGSAYWVAQQATYEVMVCLRAPDGQKGCFPVAYEPAPIP
jgi:hypothetical protein